jgi:phosphoenolpyruvate carboxylase
MISREDDRYRMPEPMRRDVRLLGSLLGGVLSEAGGQGLLDDVEQLRHAVIESRRAEAAQLNGQLDGGQPEPGSSPDDIAALVASWPLERAEQVASAFTVYFHLANLAEEHQRIRALRERDVPGHPLPESLEATVREIRRSHGGVRLEELVAGLRVHPVFTAHPTEARRRAVVASLRRISVLLDVLDDPRVAATDCASRSTFCGGHHSCGSTPWTRSTRSAR